MHWASTGHPLFQQQESPDQAGDADNSEEEVAGVYPLVVTSVVGGAWGGGSVGGTPRGKRDVSG